MWTPEEDDRLRALIERHGARRWKDLAEKLGNKTAKQCRRRYTGHLTTALKEHEWTAAEDDALLRAHEALGNKWTAIAKTVGGRTDNGAKNRFKALMQKMNASKRGKKRGTSTTSPSAARGRRRAGGGEEGRGRGNQSRKARRTRKMTVMDVVGRDESRARREDDAGARRRGRSRRRRRAVAVQDARESRRARGATERCKRDISDTIREFAHEFGERVRPNGGVATGTDGERVESRAQRGGRERGAPTSPGAFARCYSVGKTLSLSCAELELLKEVQEMIIPHGMSQSHGGARSNASAFVRFRTARENRRREPPTRSTS